MAQDDGEEPTIAAPRTVSGDLAGRRVLQLCAGELHVLALCDAGSVFSWGSGLMGALGHGGRRDERSPRLAIRFIRWFPELMGLLIEYLALVGFRVSSSSTLIMKMFLLFIILNHWCGCVWFAVHRAGVSAGRPFTWGRTSDFPIAFFTEPVADEAWYAAHPGWDFTADGPPSTLEMVERMPKEEVWDSVDLCTRGLQQVRAQEARPRE